MSAEVAMIETETIIVIGFSSLNISISAFLAVFGFEFVPHCLAIFQLFWYIFGHKKPDANCKKFEF